MSLNATVIFDGNGRKWIAPRQPLEPAGGSKMASFPSFNRFFTFTAMKIGFFFFFRAAIRKSPQRRRQPEGGREGGRIDNRWIKMQVLHPIFVQPTPHRSSDRSCSSFNDLTQPITHTTPPCYVFIKRLPADAGPFVHLQNSRRSLVYLTKVPKSETSSFGKWMSGRWLAFHRQLCKLT